MTIQEFCRLHSGNMRDIQSVVQDWRVDEIHGLLDAACTTARSAASAASAGDSMRDVAGGAVVLGDALRGGSLLDQIPPAVQEAFSALMGEKAETLADMRRLLLSHLQAEDGGWRAFDDRAIMGFISKLKGQIGENLFRDHVGDAARLAASGSQEGWDVAVRQANGAFDYVQVKLYGSASGVVRHMRDVQEKALSGALTGVDGETVSSVFFAVPDEIRQDVLRLAEKHEGLTDMVYSKGIPITAKDATNLVTEGMESVGPERLSHFFGELLCGALAAGTLHAAVNGFLVYKESKELSTALADTVTDTLVSTVGIGVGLIAESLFHTALVSGAVGISTRLFISRVTRSRWDFADFLNNSLEQIESLIGRLQQPAKIESLA